MKTIIRIVAAFTAAGLVALAPSTSAQEKKAAPAAKHAEQTRTYATPEDAAKALADALRAKKESEIVAIVGPSSKSWLLSGDPVADENDWEDFVAAYDEQNKLDKASDGRAVLTVGKDDWAFPAPIVKGAKGWSFDASAGREEFLNRRVGRNELDAMQTLLAIVDAQREYAARDPDGNGFPDYAKRLASTAGKKEGLDWPTKENETESPLGPLVAAAAREGYGKAGAPKPAPYHGYYYRLLTSQGNDAPGNAYDYLVGDKLLGGFGVVAFPATYGVSGVMTFIVSHDGVVYEKDLGGKTQTVAGSMRQFNPDSTWKRSSP